MKKEKTSEYFQSYLTFAICTWAILYDLLQNLLGYCEKSDVYSVGIATCEMANGVVPFADMPAMLMLTEKLGGRAPQLLDRYAFPLLENQPEGNKILSPKFLYSTLLIDFYILKKKY